MENLLFTCLTSDLGDNLLMRGRRAGTPKSDWALATGKREQHVFGNGGYGIDSLREGNGPDV